MKSSKEKLYNRGYFEDIDVLPYVNDSNQDIWKMLEDHHSHIRSIGIYLLSQRGQITNPNFFDYLIKQIQTETCLYTKIEICHALEKGNDAVARKLLPYLGMIGHNQHQCPGKTSKKKSYPIARDIIARTLCNMKLSEELLLELFDLPQLQLKEAIDVIGYQLFYGDYDETIFYDHIVDLMNSTKDETILWKCITCCSAFSYGVIMDRLLMYVHHENNIVCAEAKRSIFLIRERDNYANNTG